MTLYTMIHYNIKFILGNYRFYLFYFMSATTCCVKTRFRVIDKFELLGSVKIYEIEFGEIEIFNVTDFHFDFDIEL